MFQLISSVHAESKFEKGVMTLVEEFSKVIFTPIIWLLGGASIIMFFWGLVHFIISEDGTVKENGKRHMVWGVVGIFIIFSVWGIIAFVGDSVDSLKTAYIS